MRFTVTGEWTKNRLLALIVSFFLLFAFLQWLTAWGLFWQNSGFSVAALKGHYLGDPETFRAARSVRGMLEQTHAHLFAMGIMLTTLTHLLLFVPISPRTKATVVVVTFVSALLDEGSGWAIRFLHPDFAWLKIVGFLGLQAGYGSCLGLVFWAVGTRARSAYRDTEDKPTKNPALHEGREEK